MDHIVAGAVQRHDRRTGGSGGEAELIGCWTNAGWSDGLGVDPARGWTDDEPGTGGGMVSVLVARRHGWDKMTVGGFLADVYCLGIKYVAGPDVLSERDLRRFRDYFFSDYKSWQEVPLELAQTLVFGLEKLGWARGVPADAGWVGEHSKQFPGANVTAVICYEEGFSVGYWEGAGDQTIKRVFFLRGLYTPQMYPEHKDALKLADVDPIPLSEVIGDCEFLLAKAK